MGSFTRAANPQLGIGQQGIGAGRRSASRPKHQTSRSSNGEELLRGQLIVTVVSGYSNESRTVGIGPLQSQWASNNCGPMPKMPLKLSDGPQYSPNLHLNVLATTES